MSLLILGLAASVQALSGLETLYPTGLNDTAYISNSSLATYGGVYTAATDGPTAVAEYGTYDYCAMPHPRTTEYELPGPLQNGTGKLVFLEYLQRHQRRTPYNILPGGEDQPYDCSNVRTYQYGGTNSSCGTQPIPVYTQTYQDPTDPFSVGVNGSCQFPQITLGGVQDGFQHGRDLWGVYGAQLGLLPASPQTSRTWLRATDSALTQGTAGAVLRGVWPDYGGALPLRLMEGGVDTVNEGYTCAAISTIQAAYQATDAWAAHLDASADVRAALGSMLGATASAWQSTMDHFGDNFQGRLCNGYRLPCSTTDASACVTDAQAATVFRAGDWEWNYYYRTQPDVVAYIQAVEGLFIGEVVAHLQAVLDGTATLDYKHSFLHDNDLGPVLGALGITAMRWPAMGANLALEVWETSSNTTLHARVLYSGQPLETVHGTLDWIPLQQLIAILTPYVPTDVASLCG